MIKFYQPWCGFCSAMKPAWDKLAEEVNESVFIADVNCSEEPRLCSKNAVKGYPTILVYFDGELSKYEGDRDFDALYEYVDENLALHCIIDKPNQCDKKSQTFLKKWKDNKPQKEIVDEVIRLQGLMKRQVTYQLLVWMRDRTDILMQLLPRDVEIKL